MTQTDRVERNGQFFGVEIKKRYQDSWPTSRRQSVSEITRPKNIEAIWHRFIKEC